MIPDVQAGSWPRIPARWYQPTAPGVVRPVRVLVIHVMDAPEKGSTAEDVGRYFATLTERKASAHIGCDQNSTVQYVEFNDVAYAAPGCNRDGVQLELAGYSAQSGDAWHDEYSMATLVEGARAAAYIVDRYKLPIRLLTVAELLAGARGICGHDTVTAAYHESDHTDPGPHFPWPEFLGMVRRAAGVTA